MQFADAHFEDISELFETLNLLANTFNAKPKVYKRFGPEIILLENTRELKCHDEMHFISQRDGFTVKIILSAPSFEIIIALADGRGQIENPSQWSTWDKEFGLFLNLWDTKELQRMSLRFKDEFRFAQPVTAAEIPLYFNAFKVSFDLPNWFLTYSQMKIDNRPSHVSTKFQTTMSYMSWAFPLTGQFDRLDDSAFALSYEIVCDQAQEYLKHQYSNEKLINEKAELNNKRLRRDLLNQMRFLSYVAFHCSITDRTRQSLSPT
ncbi:MAG: hypothetical protein K2Y32_21670 [Candidatus Obscuribacterales bacterium]|nr:hypothetical protein [Candidatus Obscuribacterales bacterium]